MRAIIIALTLLGTVPCHANTVSPVGDWACIVVEPDYESHFTTTFGADGTVRERFDMRYPDALGVATYEGVLEGRWERRGIELHLTYERAKVEKWNDPLYGDTLDLKAFEQSLIDESSGVETIETLTADTFSYGRKDRGTIRCERAD